MELTQIIKQYKNENFNYFINYNLYSTLFV